jgi:exodeoxyribonuclease VII small subunit
MSDAMSFEKALADLEAIVAKLESGDAALDESLALFEKGVQLAKFLRQELEKAEKKIEILLKDAEGELRAEAFDPVQDGSEETPQPADTEPESEDNGSLPF